MEPILECRQIGKSYQSGGENIPALSGLNLQLFGGYVYRLFCGERLGRLALANLLSGMERADEGEILLRGRPYSTLDDERLMALQQRKIGLVHRHPGLIGGITVQRNVMLPAVFSGSDGETALLHRSDGLLSAFGLTARAGCFPAALDAGERFRTAIAAQLCKQPDLLVIDGLPAELPDETQAALSIQLQQLAAARGFAALLLVEQGTPRTGEIPLRLHAVQP